MLDSLPKIDGTIPAQAQLNPGEELLASQVGVGLYDDGQKAPNHQLGSIHVTSHRLLFISDEPNVQSSLSLQLALVAQSEHYAGFITSSAKIELIIHNAVDEDDFGLDDGWTCNICEQVNAASLGPRRVKCTLCGSPRQQQTTISRPSTSMSISTSCPACTFINTPGRTACEMCESPLPPTTRASTPKPPAAVAPPSSKSIKISFRKGGDRPFYTAMKRALQAKAWKTDEGAAAAPQASAPGAGISGILSAVETQAAQNTDTVANALRDLEALSAQAKAMAAMAATLATRLQQQQALAASASVSVTPGSTPPPSQSEGSSSGDSASFIQRSLFNMGLALPDGPAVQAAAADERKWIDDLAEEIATLLRDGLMGGRGMVALDEIWCTGTVHEAWVPLLSPSIFLSALHRAIDRRLVAVSLRTLKSGLIVLNTPTHAHAAFTARLLNARPPELEPKPEPDHQSDDDDDSQGQVWFTALGIAESEGVAFSLAVLLLEAVEDDGVLWRDVVPSSGMVRWTRNELNGYVWDGD
ncbi:EAP30/Vps36 family-domain-containing protein [Auriculariales sp. MPI-PUGE-AT-0066]|nr:EAP30/Vps36 family-domain-containing protein [Auriculariales sp. MPI-PUGE-AT-0066]